MILRPDIVTDLTKYTGKNSTILNPRFLILLVVINVIGEVYEVDGESFQALDELEDYPNDGNMASCGDTIQCWCYLLYNFRPSFLNLPYQEEYDDWKRPEDERYVGKRERDCSLFQEVCANFAE
ncbi:hypothetical protein ACJMK2_021665 [Sinanodonta woodiana]|uniref:Gamma-glutamylcyclotransferase AIG2-like domain-containing protein n=1 Tax=Sinanodonta woodiana TaxID=1069815 RepID=A0ABD3TGR8_SINWO